LSSTGASRTKGFYLPEKNLIEDNICAREGISIEKLFSYPWDFCDFKGISNRISPPRQLNKGFQDNKQVRIRNLSKCIM